MSSMVKSLRRERGWSQEHLADAAGVSVRTVQRLEAGEPCALETAQALGAAFDVRAEVFLGDETDGALAPDDAARLRALRIERQVRNRFGFYRHLAGFAIFHAVLLAINLATDPDHLWVLYSFVGWGIGIVYHAMDAFRMDWQERWIRRLVDRETAARPERDA